MSRKRTDDLEKELVGSGNWTRIDEIIKEVKQLYKRERNARAHRTNLLLGQRFLELSTNRVRSWCFRRNRKF
jgi:hypothetical protein